MKRAFRSVRGEPKQLRHGFDVPVRILWPCMAEIGAELAHLTIRVEAIAIPCHDRTNSEGMPLIPSTELSPLFRQPDYSGTCQPMYVNRRAA